ncbi:MAG: 1-deoxy-D-xylulose-5-phosphate reductoisomerase [Thermoanaerobaculia bacterium]|nr:1-deoxy-D-xylulose-5-phosphate reductoisomerase [Thermoanaerobaculia bacterium]
MTLRLGILGSTGSVGESVLEVVRHHPGRLEVTALAAYGSDLEQVVGQVEEFGPRLVALYDAERARELADRLGDAVEVVSGAQGLERLAREPSVDRLVAAMVGAAGLGPVWCGLDAGKDVALANKEVLVVAGHLVTALARRREAEIVPIDSEHVALHQALRCGAAEEVRRLVLTASGGPFRQRPASTWESITPEEALAHPTWEMGDKISIDSATLMNKGLELIEASHLFGFPPERIDVVLHPQSIIHSMVEFQDGSWLAQLSVNDMVFPVQYALSFPERWGNEFERLDMAALGRLDFEPLDEERFAAVRLARQALDLGESAPAVLNAANEVAVGSFLDGKISFPQIVETVERVLADHHPVAVPDVDAALAADAWGREHARRLLGA